MAGAIPVAWETIVLLVFVTGFARLVFVKSSSSSSAV